MIPVRPALVWGCAALFVGLYGLCVPSDPLVLVFVRRIPGVGPEGYELVLGSMAVLVLLGVLDTLRAAWWQRVETGQ